MLMSDSVQSVMQKLEVMKEIEARDEEWRRDTLLALENIIDNIDHHPAKAVELLEELHRKLEAREDVVPVPPIIVESWRPKWWQVVLFLLGVGLIGLLGAIGGVALLLKLGFILAALS